MRRPRGGGGRCCARGRRALGAHGQRVHRPQPDAVVRAHGGCAPPHQPGALRPVDDVPLRGAPLRARAADGAPVRGAASVRRARHAALPGALRPHRLPAGEVRLCAARSHRHRRRQRQDSGRRTRCDHITATTASSSPPTIAKSYNLPVIILYTIFLLIYQLLFFPMKFWFTKYYLLL